MVKIDPNSLRNWNNGEVMNEADYEKERSIIVTAINVNDDKKMGTNDILDGAVTDAKLSVGAIHENKLLLDYPTGVLSQRIKELQANPAGIPEVQAARGAYPTLKDRLDALSPTFSFPEYRTTATAGQDTFDVSSLGSFAVGQKRILAFTISGAPQRNYTELSSTQLRISEPCLGGEDVFIKFFNGTALPMTSGHANAHKAGGGDELDVASLAGMDNLMGLDPRDPRFAGGAKGDGIDDTAAFIACFELAKITKQNVIIRPVAGRLVTTYVVKDTILDWFPGGTGENGFIIEGSSIHSATVKILFKPTDPTKPLIRLANVKSMMIRDLTVESVNKTGIGLVLGDSTLIKSASSIKTYNLNLRYFDVGIDTTYAWLIEHYSPQLRYNNIGFRTSNVNSNAISVYGIVAEGNGTAVHINGGSGINFFGGCVETNDLGFRLSRGTDINLSGVYLENNAAVGHIMAGTDGDIVESINIVGGNMNYVNPMVFDKVNVLTVRGLSKFRGFASFTVTDNVKQFIADYMLLRTTGNNNSNVISSRKNRESDIPFFSTDFRNVSSIQSGTESNLTSDGKVTILPLRGTQSLDTSDFLTGKKTLKFVSASGQTYTGLQFRFYYDQFNLADQISFALRVKYTGNQKFRKWIEVVYNNSTGGTTSVTVRDSDTSVVTAMNGQYFHTFDWADLTIATTKPDFVSIARVNYSIHLATITPSVGGETIWIDSLDLYNAETPVSPYNNKSDHKNVAEMNIKSVNTDLLSLNGIQITAGESYPTSGVFKDGSICFNTKPYDGEVMGWRYMTGVWIPFGTVGDGANRLRSADGILYKQVISNTGAASWVTQTLYFDFFGRADSTTTVGTSDSGQAWTALRGIWGIQNHEVYSVSETTQDILGFPSTLADSAITCDMKGTFVDINNYSTPKLLFHLIDVSNYMFVTFVGSTVTLKKEIGGTETTLKTATVSTAFVNETFYTTKVVCQGDSIAVYINGNSILQYTMTTAESTQFNGKPMAGFRFDQVGYPPTKQRYKKFMIDKLT